MSIYGTDDPGGAEMRASAKLIVSDASLCCTWQCTCGMFRRRRGWRLGHEEAWVAESGQDQAEGWEEEAVTGGEAAHAAEASEKDAWDEEVGPGEGEENEAQGEAREQEVWPEDEEWPADPDADDEQQAGVDPWADPGAWAANEGSLLHILNEC